MGDIDFTMLASSIAYHFITKEFMQDEIKASGLKVEDIPDDVLCSDVLREYLHLRESKSHDSAVHELDHTLTMIERYMLPLSQIPRKPTVLLEMYQELYEEYQIKKLGDRLQKNPRDGKLVLKEFQIKQVGGVDSSTLEQLSCMLKHQFKVAKEKKSVVRIQGFEMLSEMIGGFNPERLGIFLGGTGFGKTNFAVNLALAAINSSMRVLYVNMEMGFTDMLKRFAVIASGVSYSDYAQGKFNCEHVESVLRQHGSKLTVTSGKALSFSQILSWCRMMNKQEPVGLLVVDYDQKVELSLGYRAEEWKALQKTLEGFEELSKELGIYCLVLAQVNRDGNISGSHRSQFPAHTVMQFENDPTHGTLIKAVKNRHGRKDQALRVIYNDDNSRINEVEIINLNQKPKIERRTLKPSPAKEEQWYQK